MSTLESVTFTPTEPLEYAGKTYTELTFKRPKVGSLAAMDAATGDVERTLAFLASLAGVPLPVLHELDLADLERISREIAPLTGEIFGQQAEEA